MYKAVLFDNDGVLVDTEKLYFESSRQVLSEVGIVLDRNLFLDISLTQGKSVFRYAVEKGFPKEQESALRDRRNELYCELIASEQDILVPGIQETLGYLSGRYLLGVVTTSLRIHFDLIHKESGLLSFFKFVLVREDYQKSKPDPEPYLLACERSGCAPSQCLVIEDTMRGLQAAIAAGIDTWVIPNQFSRSQKFPEAKRILNDISDLMNFL
jgi:HAD superfamily hydrolase (TIGR01509 family)